MRDTGDPLRSMKTKIPAVVIPADRPAPVALARLLGKRGIPVYGVDSNPQAIGMYSKFIKPRPVPGGVMSDDARLDHLMRLGRELGEAVLYPVRDNDVLLCSKNRQELQRYYRFVMPPHEVIENVLTKNGMHMVADRHNIPTSKVVQAASLSDVKEVAEKISYPVILKPVFSPSWLRQEIVDLTRENFISGPSKVALCNTPEKLIEMYQKIAAYEPKMIIEEVIPGEDHHLVYYCFYLDRNSKPLATFAGIKERVLPVGFGSATYVRSVYDPALEEISLKLLTQIGYQGLGGVEFKKDARDGIYKLIEFNARLGMWDSYGARCGVDIPFVSYCDALDLPVAPQRTYRENVLWIDFQRDFRGFIIYHRHGKLSFLKWLKSFIGEKEWAFFRWDDWKPAFHSFTELIERQFKGSGKNR